MRLTKPLKTRFQRCTRNKLLALYGGVIGLRVEEEFFEFEIEGWSFRTYTGVSPIHEHDWVDLSRTSPAGKHYGLGCFEGDKEIEMNEHLVSIYGLTGVGIEPLKQFIASHIETFEKYERFMESVPKPKQGNDKDTTVGFYVRSKNL